MEFFIANLQGLAGLVSGMGTLLAGVAALVTALRKRTERRSRNVKNGSRTEKTLWVTSASLIATSMLIFAVRAAEGGKSKNEQLVEAAWQAFNAKDYSTAIQKCNELIDEFRPAADREQLTLEQKKVPQPIKGKPPEAEKKTIFERGLLNDVGTCFFIVGRSAEYQGKADIARDAYSKAVKYSYARTWDPKGWFWSPSDAAQDRLSSLK